MFHKMPLSFTVFAICTYKRTSIVDDFWIFIECKDPNEGERYVQEEGIIFTGDPLWKYHSLNPLQFTFVKNINSQNP